MKHWPAMSRWSRESLVQRFGDVPFAAGAADFPLELFYAYAQNNTDDVAQQPTSYVGGLGVGAQLRKDQGLQGMVRLGVSDSLRLVTNLVLLQDADLQSRSLSGMFDLQPALRRGAYSTDFARLPTVAKQRTLILKRL